MEWFISYLEINNLTLFGEPEQSRMAAVAASLLKIRGVRRRQANLPPTVCVRTGIGATNGSLVNRKFQL
jgi:hypothetical protein